MFLIKDKTYNLNSMLLSELKKIMLFRVQSKIQTRSIRLVGSFKEVQSMLVLDLKFCKFNVRLPGEYMYGTECLRL